MQTMNTRTGRCGRRAALRLAVWAALALTLAATAAADDRRAVRDLPSGVAADDPLLAKGLLSVTHFGAVPDDAKDDTSALQKAVDAARDFGLVAYFPSGVYLLSDTLLATQPVAHRDDKWRQDRRRANALVGASTGARPVLRLAERAPGFNDPGQPKPLVWFWAQARSGSEAGSDEAEDEQPNISFNQVFKGIDIDLRGGGHAGAVGIRHAGSQGSSIEEVSIRAEGAFAGLYNLPGQGGGVYGVSVSGGRYGVWANHQSRYPIMAGVRLTNQEAAAIYWNGQSNLTVAGFVIERAQPGPVVTMQRGRQAHNRALTLVDGTIQGAGALAIDNGASRSLFLQDVYLSGYSGVVKSGPRAAVKTSGQVTRVAEYAFTGNGSKSMIQDRIQEPDFELASVKPASELPSAESIVRRHLWPGSFPSADAADAVSIIKYGARADDEVDDTDAILTAIEKHKAVLVPAGTFVVSKTLRLGADTQLIGVGKHLSVIRAADGWKPDTGTPIVTTVDSAQATTSLSFLLIERPAASPGLTLLEWRAGRRSVVRDLMGGQYGTASDALAAQGSTYAIRGNGGGRWYGLAAEWNRMSPGTQGAGYRHLLVEATREPLAFYGLNIERGRSDPQAEILNSRNVAIYSLKGESLRSAKGGSAVLQVSNSQNVSLFGYSGNAAPGNNAVLRMVDSDDFVLANVMPVRPGREFETIRTRQGTGTVSIDGDHPASIVRRGNPLPLVW